MNILACIQISTWYKVHYPCSVLKPISTGLEMRFLLLANFCQLSLGGRTLCMEGYSHIYHFRCWCLKRHLMLLESFPQDCIYIFFLSKDLILVPKSFILS